MPSATEAPVTQVPCPGCGRPATPGKFCAACGARTPQAGYADAPPAPPQLSHEGEAAAPRRRRSWLAAGIAAAAVVAVAAIAAIVLISVGGDPATTSTGKRADAVSVNAVRLSASNLYAPVEGGEVSGLIPAGWARRPAQLEGVEGGLTAVSAQDKDASVTLGVLSGGDGSLAERARALRDERKSLPGYRESSFRQLTLAGERPAWKLLYKRDERSTVEYLTAECDRVLVISGTAPDAIFGTLENRFGVMARSFQAVC